MEGSNRGVSSGCFVCVLSFLLPDLLSWGVLPFALSTLSFSFSRVRPRYLPTSRRSTVPFLLSPRSTCVSRPTPSIASSLLLLTYAFSSAHAAAPPPPS